MHEEAIEAVAVPGMEFSVHLELDSSPWTPPLDSIDYSIQRNRIEKRSREIKKELPTLKLSKFQPQLILMK